MKSLGRQRMWYVKLAFRRTSLSVTACPERSLRATFLFPARGLLLPTATRPARPLPLSRARLSLASGPPRSRPRANGEPELSALVAAAHVVVDLRTEGR